MTEQDNYNELMKKFKEIGEEKKASKAIKVFFAIPSLHDIGIGLTMRLFEWAKNPNIKPHYHFTVEKRHHDLARNIICRDFLKTDCEYLCMVDSDVVPPSDFPDMVTYGKDIVSARVHCWIAGTLMPSIWQKAECEECRVIKTYMESGTIHDESMYVEKDGTLFRWSPEKQDWFPFANRETGIIDGQKCRCNGTGLDPWVYRTWQRPYEIDKLLKVDSIGSAAFFVHRRVIEKIPPPWFSFYYKPSREIMLTEDHYFAWKAQIFGFEIWADMKKTCSHIKMVDLAHVEHALMNAFERGKAYERKKRDQSEIPNEIKLFDLSKDSIIGEVTSSEGAENDKDKNL